MSELTVADLLVRIVYLENRLEKHEKKYENAKTFFGVVAFHVVLFALAYYGVLS